MRFAAALAGHGLPWPAFCIGFSFWGSPPCSPRFPYFPTPRLPLLPIGSLLRPAALLPTGLPPSPFSGPRRPFSSVSVGVRLPPRPLPPASEFLAPALARDFYFDRLPRFPLSCPRLPPLPPPSGSTPALRSAYTPSLLTFYFRFPRPLPAGLSPSSSPVSACTRSSLSSRLLCPLPALAAAFLIPDPGPRLLLSFHPPFRLYPAALSPSVFTFAVPRSRSLLAPSHPLLSFLYPPSLRALRFSVRLPRPLPSRLFRPLFPFPSHPTSPSSNRRPGSENILYSLAKCVILYQ